MFATLHILGSLRSIFQSSLLRLNIPFEYVKVATGVFIVLILSLLAITFIYLLRRLHIASRKNVVQKTLSIFLSEIILSESTEELHVVLEREEVQKTLSRLLLKRYERNVLLTELVKMNRHVSGSASENICWLYNHLGLDKDSLKNLRSTSWHKKARAIQELSQMGQVQYLNELYTETNNSSEYIRTEAQVAVAKLTGSDGLHFLQLAIHPVTQWQQLCLLQQLSEQSHFQYDQLPVLLHSANETVVQFALRLVEHYKYYQAHDDVVSCLQYPSFVVRRQAIAALKEIYQESTALILQQHFLSAEKEEQLQVLRVLYDVGNEDLLPFVLSLLKGYDDAVTYAAIKILQTIREDWQEMVERYTNQQSLLITEIRKGEAA